MQILELSGNHIITCSAERRYSVGKVTKDTKTNKTQNQKHKVYCAQCQRETNHVVLQSVDWFPVFVAIDAGSSWSQFPEPVLVAALRFYSKRWS